MRYRRLVWKQQVRERMRHPKQPTDWPFIVLLSLAIAVIFLIKFAK